MSDRLISTLTATIGETARKKSMWCEGYRGRVAEGDRAICPTNLYLSRAWFYPRPALASCAGYGVAQALAILSGVSVGVRRKASREGRLRIGACKKMHGVTEP